MIDFSWVSYDAGFEPGGLGPRECLNGQCGSSNNDTCGENFAVLRFEAEFPLVYQRNMVSWWCVL